MWQHGLTSWLPTSGAQCAAESPQCRSTRCNCARCFRMAVDDAEASADPVEKRLRYPAADSPPGYIQSDSCSFFGDDELSPDVFLLGRSDGTTPRPPRSNLFVLSRSSGSPSHPPKSRSSSDLHTLVFDDSAPLAYTPPLRLHSPDAVSSSKRRAAWTPHGRRERTQQMAALEAELEHLCQDLDRWEPQICFLQAGVTPPSSLKPAVGDPGIGSNTSSRSVSRSTDVVNSSAYDSSAVHANTIAGDSEPSSTPNLWACQELPTLDTCLNYMSHVAPSASSSAHVSPLGGQSEALKTIAGNGVCEESPCQMRSKQRQSSLECMRICAVAVCQMCTAQVSRQAASDRTPDLPKGEGVTPMRAAESVTVLPPRKAHVKAGKDSMTVARVGGA